jgi:hypothetical protein
MVANYNLRYPIPAVALHVYIPVRKWMYIAILGDFPIGKIPQKFDNRRK